MKEEGLVRYMKYGINAEGKGKGRGMRRPAKPEASTGQEVRRLLER